MISNTLPYRLAKLVLFPLGYDTAQPAECDSGDWNDQDAQRRCNQRVRFAERCYNANPQRRTYHAVDLMVDLVKRHTNQRRYG